MKVGSDRKRLRKKLAEKASGKRKEYRRRRFPPFLLQLLVSLSLFFLTIFSLLSSCSLWLCLTVSFLLQLLIASTFILSLLLPTMLSKHDVQMEVFIIIFNSRFIV